MKNDTQTQRTLSDWFIDPCPDADGFFTIRINNGSEHGDLVCYPIATVYEIDDAELIVSARRLKRERDELLAVNAELVTALTGIKANLQPCRDGERNGYAMGCVSIAQCIAITALDKSSALIGKDSKDGIKMKSC